MAKSALTVDLTLIGYRYSVYTRIVRMALIELGLQATYVEANPFAATLDPVLAAHTPFGRVPVLRHDAFTLTETAAILGYLDGLGNRASLVPEPGQSAARMTQVIGIIDAYGYEPMVRQVFSHGSKQPAMADENDQTQVTTELQSSLPILGMLESISAEGLVLNTRDLTLADIHLAPMIDYFVNVPEGAKALAAHGTLDAWWKWMENRPSLRATDPFTQH